MEVKSCVSLYTLFVVFSVYTCVCVCVFVVVYVCLSVWLFIVCVCVFLSLRGLLSRADRGDVCGALPGGEEARMGPLLNRVALQGPPVSITPPPQP